MNEEKLYDKKIKDLEREIRLLKTSHFKTATTISTMTKTTSVSFSLTLDQMSGEVYGTQRAIITLTTTDGSDMISACYLTGVTPSNIDDRIVGVKRLQAGNGTVRFGVDVFSNNYNDWNTLYNGGSINLSYSLQLIGSSEFNVSVAYKAINGGTV